MKCRCCKETLRCGACGSRAISTQTLWARKVVKQGRCPRCGVKKTALDGPQAHCRPCRLKNAARMKKSYELRKAG